MSAPAPAPHKKLHHVWEEAPNPFDQILHRTALSAAALLVLTLLVLFLTH